MQIRGHPTDVTWRAPVVAAPVTNAQSNAPPGAIPPAPGPHGFPVAQLPARPWNTQLQGQGTGVPGTPVSRASGNPGVSTVDTVPPPQVPYGVPRPLGVGQETSWRGGAGLANNRIQARDRHLFSKIGYENTGRNSGFTDPPSDGPARPSYQTINRSLTYQSGSDAAAATDDLTRGYSRNAQGMYVGEQGTGWAPVYGGVPGLWQPYGSYAGVTNGPVKGIQSPVPQGSQGDGRQVIWSGPPHGLHSPTMPDYSPILGYYMAVPQMRAPRVDRPSNSTIGGQSYSQTVVPQGQTGTIAQNTQVGAGVNWQTQRVSGWRGQAGRGNAGY
jgi:hypothetical protein